MPSSTILQQTKRKKDQVLVNVFAGIDRSTARFRIEGKGERLYEMSNVFPYIQGRLQRRRDPIQTNRRASDAAFPTFPAQSLTGWAIVKSITEFNDNIIIFYIDSSARDVVLADRFDVGANTLTALIQASDAEAVTANGDIRGTPYNWDAPLGMVVSADGNHNLNIDGSWALTDFHAAIGSITAIGEVFLQTFFNLETGEFNRLNRTAPKANTFTVSYDLTGGVGQIMRLMAFGYQTSSAGATTVLLVFRPSSIWVLTGIGSTESFEQITGNIGLVGKDAVVYTPFGVCFVGRDTDGLLNLYLLDRNSLVLHTIGHELYEELNDIKKGNYDNVLLSFHRNRMVRIAMTQTADSVSNNQEYWLDFYNGLKKRTVWGPNFLPAGNSLDKAISFSGGNVPNNAGFFMLLREGTGGETTTKIYEETNLDTYDSTDSEWDDQVWRTKIYDFGRFYGIVNNVIIVARANGAKFKVYYEEPKLTGDDDDTTQTLIGSFQMGTGGAYVTKPIRIVPAILKNQIGIKIESDYDGDDNEPLEISQLGFEYEITQREVIE